MAERRMFSKTIIDSDDFLELDLSAQAFYFHLAMRADDDGFVNKHKVIQRMVGASNNDLNALIEKGLLLILPSGLAVITHWRIHNYIRSDRKKNTIYTDDFNALTQLENGAYAYNNPQFAGFPPFG